MPLKQFLRFVADFKSVGSLAAKAALAAPFVDLIVNLGPPWPYGATVPILSSLAEMLVLIYSFQFYPSLPRAALRRRLRLFFLLLGGTFVLYLVLYSFLVFDVPIEHGRDVKGFIVQPAVVKILGPAYTLENALEGAEWDPFQIWVEWTIHVARIVLMLIWVLWFVGIVGCMAVFVILQRTARSGTS